MNATAEYGEITAADYAIDDRGYATPCWIWSGSVHKSAGYGARYGGGRGKYVYAHVLADRLANGPAPSGVIVHHRCEQKLCVRPDHLERMTQADHVRLHLRKYSPELIERARRATGSTRQIAHRYGISKSHVAALRRPDQLP